MGQETQKRHMQAWTRSVRRLGVLRRAAYPRANACCHRGRRDGKGRGLNGSSRDEMGRGSQTTEFACDLGVGAGGRAGDGMQSQTSVESVWRPDITDKPMRWAGLPSKHWSPGVCTLAVVAIEATRGATAGGA